MPWHTLCVDLIITKTILFKVRQPDNKIFTKELQVLCMKFIDLEIGWFEILINTQLEYLKYSTKYDCQDILGGTKLSFKTAINSRGI